MTNSRELRAPSSELRVPSVSFKTVGCRLNQAETAAISAQFESDGYEVVSFDQPSDVVVIHTCAVTRVAEKKCISYARAARKRNPNAKVVLAGCAVEVSEDELRERTGADLLVGQDGKYCIPAKLKERFLDFARNDKETIQSPAEGSRGALVPRHQRTRVVVKVQDGCDFHCAYCIVPTTRGAPTSRPAKAIIEEVATLVKGGYAEFVLTGANLGCYSHEDSSLSDLIRQIDRVPDVKRIRISSTEPLTGERDVIDAIADCSHVCRALHIPLQTGSDRILTAMGRRYNAGQYRAVIEHAASRLGRFGLGTDIVVGLPGEDDSAFEETMALVRELPFTKLHVFRYSKRPGTRAAEMDDQVSEDVKRNRMEQLIALGNSKRQVFAEAHVGETVKVLIEQIDDSGVGLGWTGDYLRCQISGVRGQIGDLVDVCISGRSADVLIATGG